MLGRTAIFLVFTIFVSNIYAKSIDKSSEEDIFPVSDALKKFVEFANKHDLNVSIITSQNKKGPIGYTKELIAVTIHMPKSDKQLTTPSLDTTEQAKYLQAIKQLNVKEKIGAKIRTVFIENGQDKQPEPQYTFHDEYFIDSLNYRLLTVYKDGKQGFYLPEHQTAEVLYNFVVKEGDERNIQVITGNVVVVPLEASPDMPIDTYTEELKKSLPLIWMSVDDDTLIAKLLAKKLDEVFPGKNHQVLIGVKNWFNSAQMWAKYEVADSTLIIFCLPEPAPTN